MDFKKIVSEEAVKTATKIITGLMITYLGYLLLTPLSKILPTSVLQWIASLDSIVLGKVTVLILLLSIFQFAYTLRLRKKLNSLTEIIGNKLKPKFNVLWDKELNPYCPICKNLLNYQPPGKNPTPYLLCAKHSFFYLVDENENKITLQEARRKLTE